MVRGRIELRRVAHKFAVWKMVSFIVAENERLIDVNIRSDSVNANFECRVVWLSARAGM